MINENTPTQEIRDRLWGTFSLLCRDLLECLPELERINAIEEPTEAEQQRAGMIDGLFMDMESVANAYYGEDQGREVLQRTIEYAQKGGE